MRANRRPAAERFAEATDAMLRGEILLDGEAIGAEYALAARLRRTASAGVPDPAFLEGLRGELMAKVAAKESRMVSVRYATIETPIGRLGVAHRNGLVVYCTRIESHDEFERGVATTLGAWPVREESLPPALERGIRDHLAGRRRMRSVDLSWLPPFQRRVLEKTAQISLAIQP
jgi:hypothetical protein